MTPTTRWHPEDPELQAYVDGRPGGLSAASVEAHLLACGTCRSTVRDGVPAARLATVLAALDDRIDGLERSRTERTLRRLGVNEPDARALLAAPSMRIAWWGAVLAALLLALLITEREHRPEALMLLVAPLLPVISTAAAFARSLDPAHAIVAATPYRTSRMLLIRSLAVGGTALVGTALAALALPAFDLAMVAWLLPALALTLLVLALSPWLGTGSAAGMVAGGWALFVAVLEQRGGDLLTTFGELGQLVSAGLAVLALAVVLNQWKRLDQGGRA